MILKIDEICEITGWKEVECEKGIKLQIRFKTDYFIYELNEREVVLFRRGFSPVEVLRTYDVGQQPVITINCWKHYEQGD